MYLPPSLWGLPGAIGDSLRNLSHLGIAHNRLTRLDRSLLEALGHLDTLALRGNPWKCDCQLIGLKLWLETYLFKGKSTSSSKHWLGNVCRISAFMLSCWVQFTITVLCNSNNADF